MFSFNTSSAAGSPLESKIETATNPQLTETNWVLNLDVCDMINDIKDGSSIANNAIIQRFRKNDAKITSLTLSLSECLCKNCEKSFPQALSQPFFDEIILLASGKLGSANSKEAIRFLEELNTDYGTFNVKIKDTYECLSAKGLLSDRVMTSGSESGTAHIAQPNEHEFKQLDQDLNLVIEKLKSCRVFLREGKKIDTDETLNNLVGFLEACRDRMADLLDAGAHGLLTEQFYDKTLKVNDALTRTLEAEMTGSAIATDDDLASYSPSFSIEGADTDRSGEAEDADDSMWKEIKDVAGSRPTSTVTATQDTSSAKPSPIKGKSPIWDEDIDAFLNSPETGNTPIKAPGNSTGDEGVKATPAVDIDQFFSSLG